MELLKKHAEKLRFAIVGGANTALDFALLFLFVALGLNSIAANYISTSIAFIFSFFVNKSFTFKSKGGNVKKQFALFIGITIIALWVIQPLLILAVTALLSPFGWNESLVLFIAKLVATVGSLIWNYIFYSRLVFKKAEE
jgi:putative flippase GtrA